MRILFFLYSFLLLSFTGIKVQAQGFTGKVKNDSACILIRVPAFTGWELLSNQWGVAPERLRYWNPGIDTSSAAQPVEICIPIYHLLKNDACEGCEPVYHSVGKSEGLYRIGKWYGNQPASVLKKRNNLRTDALTPGQQLLVGYILPSPKQIADTTGAGIAMATPKDTANAAVADSAAEEPNEIPKPIQPRRFLSYEGEGVFAAEFAPGAGGLVKKTGKASSFKTESGWSDGRFYVLNSNLKTGLVVKVSNPVTGAYLYAKVVGPLPDIKQNQGLVLRLNSAAAAMLGFWEEEKVFDLTWEY